MCYVPWDFSMPFLFSFPFFLSSCEFPYLLTCRNTMTQQNISKKKKISIWVYPFFCPWEAMSLAYNDSPVVRQLNLGHLQSPSALFMAEAWDMEEKLYPFCQEITFIFGQLQWFLRKCFPVWVWTCISVIFNHCSLLCLLCPPELKLFSSSWLLFYYVKTSISLPIPSSSLFQRVFLKFTCETSHLVILLRWASLWQGSLHDPSWHV